MKDYEIECKCIVRKIVIVNAKHPTDAEHKFNEGNWKDETEIEMMDWEIISGPKLLK